MIIIEQNTTSKIVLPLADYFEAVDLKNIIAIEVTFGTKPHQSRKLWYIYDGEKTNMTFVKSTNCLDIKLLPSESAYWRHQVPIQIRIKNRQDKIISSDIFYANIKTILSAEEF